MGVQSGSGELNVDDIIFPAPAGGGFSRADEWDVDFDRTILVNQPVTISLTRTDNSSYDPFLQVIDADTGQVIAFDNDIDPGNNNNSQIPGSDGLPDDDGVVMVGFSTNYRIRVTSFAALNTIVSDTTYPYNLIVNTPVGDDNAITLTERSSTFANPQTGNVVNVENQQLNADDFILPVGTGFTPVDEFKISATTVGRTINVALNNIEPDPNNTGTFTPQVEVINADDGTIVAPAGTSINFPYPGGSPNLRVRVANSTPTSIDSLGNYTLQVNVDGTGEVTLTPRVIDNSIIPGGGGTTGTVSINSPQADDTDPGNPVGGVTENAVNEFDNRTVYLFSNDDDVETVPDGQTDILALSGNDRITGRDSAEQISGNRGADSLLGEGGADLLWGGRGSDSLDGGDSSDSLSGNNNNDTLVGGDSSDVIFGGKEDDILLGGSGNDTLSGDRGQDILTGGDGADVFVVSGTSVSPTNEQDADVIVDFQPNVDKIMLPANVAASNLTLTSVELELDNQPTASSTLIELNGSFLGIVQNIQPDGLNLNADFIPDSLSDLIF